MEKTVLFAKKYSLVFAVFSSTSIYYLARYALSCRIYSLQFDNQALLLWDYVASIGLTPYKDTFFPYGILYYFKNSDIVFNIIYYLIPGLLFSIFFVVFNIATKNRAISLVAILTFLIFVELFTGHEVFVRYGTLAAYAAILGCILYVSTTLSIRRLLILGIISGIIFSLLIDIGVYSIFVFSIFYFLTTVLHKKNKKYTFLLRDLLLFFGGFLTGIIPLLIYLVSEKALWDFVSFFRTLSYIPSFAKTPFPPYSTTPDNVFVLGLLLLAIIHLSLNVFLSKKFTIINYLQLAMVVVIVLLEQKSIFRSLSWQLTFTGFLLFLFLFIELQQYLQKRVYQPILLSFLLLSIIVLFFGSGFIQLPEEKRVRGVFGESCIELNRKNLLEVNRHYGMVKSYLESMPNSNKKIFTFPSDPLFYILFNQIPPYYTNIYDASLEEAQDLLIKHLRQNSINFVILNTAVQATQDGVPDYIRGKKLLQHLLTHYTLEKKIANFIILKRLSNSDFFTKFTMDTIPAYAQSLLDIDLSNIPKSEGIYKAETLEGKKALQFSSAEELNKYLGKNKVSSKGMVLRLKFDIKEENRKNSLSLLDQNNTKTKISFNSCDDCIISISNIPLFYNEKVISKIESSNSPSEIMIYFPDDFSTIW